MLPFPARRGASTGIAATSALVAAAALLLFFRLSPPGAPEQEGGPTTLSGANALPPVPAYTVAIEGGDQRQRAAPDAKPAPGATTSLGPGGMPPRSRCAAS